VALPATPTDPISRSNHEAGNGCVVTVNGIALLSFMLGATVTSSGPDVAPVGIVIVIPVLPHVLIVTGDPFNRTALFPCVAPNPVPVITTWLPTDPVVAETLVITGAGAAPALTDTLSIIAVANEDVVRFVTASPTYTFAAIAIVWLVPNGAQFTPSGEPYIVNTFPLLTSFSVFGSATLEND
jgi:hypothetical protein